MNAQSCSLPLGTYSQIDADAPPPSSRRRGLPHAGQRAANAEMRAISAMVRREGPLPPEKAICLVRKAARAAADGRHARNAGKLVFALGVMLFIALTGRAPSVAGDVSTPSPSEFSPYAVHPSLDAVVRMCLAAQPDDRFSSAAELSAALSALSVGQSGTLDHTAARRPVATAA